MTASEFITYRIIPVQQWMDAKASWRKVKWKWVYFTTSRKLRQSKRTELKLLMTKTPFP